MKKLICLLLVFSTVSASAQLLPGEMPKTKILDDEIGVRYGAQIGVGKGSFPELQGLMVDYARYNYDNIGFRTGLNVLCFGDIDGYFSVPMQFSWRTHRMSSAWRQRRKEGVSPVDPAWFFDNRNNPDIGSGLASLAASTLPGIFEAHTGFTPGIILGSKTPHSDLSDAYTVEHRFTCTFDIGARIMIPVWRFNIIGDVTYHYYLTDNFSRGNTRQTRSFFGLSAGVSFYF